jgi:glycosyltransferase 2 family protein
MSRRIRVVLTLLVTALCAAYVLWKIDVGRTLELLVDVNLGYLAAAVAVMVVTTWPMAMRWQWLLDAKGIHDRLNWLTRAYFVSYAFSQVLPTGIGGDASRIYETARRHPGNTGTIAGSVVIERALGGAATLVLAAFGLLLAIGEYDIGVYLWIEIAAVVALLVGAVAAFSRTVQRWFAWLGPPLARVRLERPLRALYQGVHGFRDHAGALFAVFALSLGIQIARIGAIWMTGEAVGVDLSLRPYFVLGPLLFLVMLVPFTVNGIGVREAFFVSFLGRIGVDADAAFAVGFLFFLLTVAIALPGLAVILWEGVRRTAPAAVQRDA